MASCRPRILLVGRSHLGSLEADVMLSIVGQLGMANAAAALACRLFSLSVAKARSLGMYTTKVLCVGAGGDDQRRGHTIVCTTNGTFAFGVSDDGRLGCELSEEDEEPMDSITSESGSFVWVADMPEAAGNTTWHASCDQCYPAPLQLARLARIVVQAVSAGSRHSVLCTRAGQVFCWGSGDYGSLGLGDTDPRDFPQRMEALSHKRAVGVAAGGAHTTILDASGAMYTTGLGSNGQLGRCSTNVCEGEQCALKPGAVEGLPAVAQVSAGWLHTAVCTREGVYTFGAGGYGQLGSGHERDLQRPYLVGGPLQGKSPVDVAAGDEHTVVCTTDGTLFTFGSSDNGQLGHGNTNRQLEPRQVEAVSSHRIVQVGVGCHHTLCIGDSGQLWTWGCGDSGMLGHAGTQNESSPRVVESLLEQRVVGIASGTGAHHSVVWTKDDLFTFGIGYGGRLGHGDEQDEWIPRALAKQGALKSG